jgi:hypothetical protein
MLGLTAKLSNPAAKVVKPTFELSNSKNEIFKSSSETSYSLSKKSETLNPSSEMSESSNSASKKPSFELNSSKSSSKFELSELFDAASHLFESKEDTSEPFIDYEYEDEHWTIENIIKDCYSRANPEKTPFNVRTKREFDKNLDEMAFEMSKTKENVLYREAYVFVTNKLIQELEVKTNYFN